MNNDDIRAPDEVKTECLLPNNNYIHYQNNNLPTETEEEQIMRAMLESEAEYELQHAILESRRIEKEREDRMKHFAGFKTKMTQFMRIDREHTQFYGDVIRYIEKYETGEINSITVGEEFAIKFRRTLDNMRLGKEERTRLLQIFNA